MMAKNFQAAKALMRADKRESLRAAALLCTTPLLVPRINSGVTFLKAATAAALSPAAIADSSALTAVRIRFRREWLRAWARVFRRMRFRADLC